MFNLKNVCGLVVAITMSASGAVVQAREMVSVDRSQVNLRAGAGTHTEALWVLSRGYPLEVTGRKGQWLKVRDFENDSGWIFRPMVGKTPHLIVKSKVANIRSTPSTRSPILGQAQYGDVVRRLEHRQEWVKIERDDGIKGWIARKLLWGW